MPLPFEQYCSGDYLAHNPTWDADDSPWKVAQLLQLLRPHGIAPNDIVDVGCGAGRVLTALRASFPAATLVGYEVATDAARFWSRNQDPGIRFVVGDFLQSEFHRFDLLLLLDVIEHLPNPFEFLLKIRGRAKQYIFHFPLDLSSLTVLRERPLLESRRQVGHIHYFTKGLALSLLDECGFQVIDWRYTGAWRTGPQHTLKTRMAAIPRALASVVSKDLSTRLFGGETLMVLARADER